ncbi:IPT/TIG domain-containing protein [Myxococcota bacterium]|nr:IPT/TIG domain-containing protein [Myxococcota bacterium]
MSELRNLPKRALIISTLVAGLTASGEARAQSTTPPNYTASLGSVLHMFKHWTSEFAFVDAFKHSRPWLTQCNLLDPQCTASNTWDTGEAALLDLDPDGWVRSLPAPSDAPIYTAVGTTMFTDLAGHYPAGQYVVLYEGEGTIVYSAAATKNNALSSTGRDVIDVNPANGHIYLRITSTDPNRTGNYIRNIRVIMPGFESTYQTQIFYPEFLERLSRYSTIRFMQWQETQNSAQENWSDRPRATDASYNQPWLGVPLEVMVTLSNRLQADAWFSIPHRATDTYITEMATLVRDSLDPTRKVYIEYSNEVWNDAQGYPQGRWVEQQALARWPNEPGDALQKRLNYHGMRTAQACDIWKSVFGAQASRVKCVMGAQAANSWTAVQALDCTLWTEGAPCSAHGIDAVAIAPYMEMHTNDPAVQAQVDAIAAGPNAVDRMFDQLWYGGVLTLSYSGSELELVREQMEATQAVAVARGLDMYAYEGGTNFYEPTGDQAIRDLFEEVVTDERMGLVYDDYFAAWRESGGKLFMHYVNVAKHDSNGTVGALEYYDQETSPKWEAINRFLDDNPCWWGCRCGDSVVDAGETCDDGNRANGDCCSSVCALDPATTVCRASAGSCDLAEQCTGISAGCPSDVKSTAVCRPVANACDAAAELCTGSTDTCPADAARDCSYLTSACATAFCDPVTGCGSTAINENGPCNDNNPATVIDVCYLGACVAGNPVPALTSITPNTGVVGGNGGTMTINGTGFVSSSRARWGSTNLTTTYVSPTRVTAAITATQLAVNGTYDIVVTNPVPGGGASAPRTFTLTSPAPTLSSISPTTGTANVTTTLTLNGTGFVANSDVRFGTTSLPMTSRTTTQIVVSVPDTLMVAGTISVTVVNPAPGGGTTTARTITVSNLAPVLTSITPNSAQSTVGAATITLTGSAFVPASVAQVNGVAVATTYVSPTQIRATIPATTTSVAGTYGVTVFNGTPGGGTSASQTFTVFDVSPVLTSISPTRAVLGDVATTITLTGSNLRNYSVATFAGTALTTTYVSTTQLTAVVPGTSLTTAGTYSVTVSTLGALSAAQTFTVENPLPVITALSPASVVVGAAATTVTVTGSGFVTGSVIRFAGADLATTYVSSTSLTATIPATSLATLGEYAVTVFNPAPGGGSSASQTFTAGNPIPTITTLSPAIGPTGSAGGPITVNGTNFLAGSVVRFNGTALATTYVSATQLRATLTAATLATSGTYPVTVSNPAPGGGSSAPSNFVVMLNPVPVLTTLTPAAVTVGSAAFTLTLTGSSFVNGSVVTFAAVPRATTFVSSTQLTATIPATAVVATGTYNVTVFNPAPGGGTSAVRTLAVNNATPVITSLSPSTAQAGASAITLTVNGTSFLNGASISWNGAALTTTFVSATQLTASVAATSLATAGTNSVTVTNPAPTAGPSAASTFTVENPLPVVTSISPASAYDNAGDTTITVTGSGFVASSSVLFAGLARTTTFVSSTELTALIPSSALALAGTYDVAVSNVAPGGGMSASQTFTVLVSAPVAQTLSPSSVTAGAAATTITVSGSNFLEGATLTWNGAALVTTWVSSTSMTAVVPATSLATAGTFSVAAVNPNGFSSTSLTFTVNNPAPTLTTLNPSAAPQNFAGGTLTLTGTSFLPTSVVTFNGTNLVTTYVSATQVTARITTAQTAVSGSYEVRVVNPAPGGGTSSARNFFVGTNPAPVLTSLSPSSITAGSAAFTLTVNGTSFVPGALVAFNNNGLVATYVSATQLTVTIPATYVATAGTFNVYSANPAPNAGNSNTLSFTVNPR